MKLVYWKCCHVSEGASEDIRAKTKKAAKEERAKLGMDMFGEPFKVTIEYESGFDLLCRCMYDGANLEDYVPSSDAGGEVEDA